MNKIKEINEEMFWDYYSFINSDKREVFLDVIVKEQEEYKMLKFKNFDALKDIVSYEYVSDIIKEFKIKNNRILVHTTVENIHKMLKDEFEKEGRCKLVITKGIGQFDSDAYYYNLEGYIKKVFEVWPTK